MECTCIHAQSCPPLWDNMDCNLPGSSVHGIFQTRIQNWVAISFSRGSSQPRDQTRISCVSCFGRRVFNHWTTWDTWNYKKPYYWAPPVPPSCGRLLPGITGRAWAQDSENNRQSYLPNKQMNEWLQCLKSLLNEKMFLWLMDSYQV